MPVTEPYLDVAIGLAPLRHRFVKHPSLSESDMQPFSKHALSQSPLIQSNESKKHLLE
jgi:hypothetical protein